VRLPTLLVVRARSRISTLVGQRHGARDGSAHARPQNRGHCFDIWKLNHRGSRCTFEAIVEDFAVSDPAIQKLALIVRAADVKGQEDVAAEGIGLRSIAKGFAAMGLSDEERLLRQFPIYDALYAFVQNMK